MYPAPVAHPPQLSIERQPACGDVLAQGRNRADGELPRIPGYRLERKVGAGRTAIAYLAKDMGCDDAVVLKVLRREHAACPARTASFVNEFVVPAGICNPHVIRVDDQFVGAGQAWIVMEHLAGGDLGQLIRTGLDPATALSLLGQAALALRAVHEHGFAHGDVKPANLLRRSTGQLVLADFGQARRLDAVRARRPDGTVVGTPRYAAPEQSQGGAIGSAGDVYSLGAVFHEMLTGRPAFPGESVMELSAQHLVAPVPRLAGALARFQPLLDAMLDKHAGTRLQDGRAVLDRIDFIQGAAPLHPRPRRFRKAGV